MPTTPLRPTPVLLELDLTVAPLETEPDDPIGKLRARTTPRLRPMLRALHEAGRDPRVRGLIAKVGGDLPWATAQELRDGVTEFARSGKPTVAWAETFADGGNGTIAYTLASAFGEIWLQPTGELGLLGVASETTFLRGALDKLGVEPQINKRYEYKNAADRIMNTQFTPEHREAIEAVTRSVWDHAVTVIAHGRGLSEDAVRAAADAAPLSATGARDAGLTDHLGYRDQVYTAVRERVGDDADLMFAEHWRPKRRLPRRDRSVVALIEAVGGIAGGRSRGGPQPRVGSDTVAAAFRAARRDEHVRAVLFRVDSPGGSAVASDTIWREAELTRQQGKPVVVSMGSLAASGGYYVACGADEIVADPATLTGSIGVFGGKVVVSGLLERLGLGTGAVGQGERSRMYSARERFSDAEVAALDRMLDDVYETFLARVAAGRSKTRDEVHELARGRVWTGADAHERGLVDTLGGIRVAARAARSRAGLRDDAPVRPAVHVAPLDRLRRPRSSEDPRAASTSMSAWGDLGLIAAALGLPASGPLTMPPLRLR